MLSKISETNHVAVQPQLPAQEEAAQSDGAPQVAPYAFGNFKYFGYLHTGPGCQPDVVGHTNISVFIWGTMTYAQLRQELAAVKANGNKAVVSTPMIFSDPTYYILYPDAQNRLTQFANNLINDGFLNPNNPESGTVVAFYPVDEPELHGLADINGIAAPRLAQLVNMFRTTSVTRLVPLATCASTYYPTGIAGYRLFDWIGIDQYWVNEDAYIGKFDQLQSLLQLKPNQRMFLVPKACTFYDGSSDIPYHDPDRMYAVARNNPAVIGIIPFLWNSVPNITGLRDDPNLQYCRERWRVLGQSVKFSGANAQFISQNIPTVMIAGRAQAISITMRNTGDVVWEPGVVHLGTQNPPDNLIWGAGRVWIPNRVLPGQLVTLHFTVQVPSVPGYYNMQGRMVAENITWFGNWTPNVVVNVVRG